MNGHNARFQIDQLSKIIIIVTFIATARGVSVTEPNFVGFTSSNI